MIKTPLPPVDKHLAVPAAEAGHAPSSAVLDSAHIGDIQGAFGTVRLNEAGSTTRSSWKTRIKTLLAIIGPGLIVMVGDNDAGAFGTYTQAGQNYARACSGRSCSSCLSSTSTRRWCCASVW